MIRRVSAPVAFAPCTVGGPPWATAASSAPPPVAAYGKLPAIEALSLSPSGQRYAFIAVVGEARKLVAETVDGSKVLLAQGVGKAKVRSVEWAGEDHLLVTITSTVNIGMDFTQPVEELASVVVIDLQKRKSFEVSADYPHVAKTVCGSFGTATVGGRLYGYFGGITFARVGSKDYFQHGYPDLYRVDLESGQPTFAARGSETIDGWLVSPARQVDL